MSAQFLPNVYPMSSQNPPKFCPMFHMFTQCPQILPISFVVKSRISSDIFLRSMAWVNLLLSLMLLLRYL